MPNFEDVRKKWNLKQTLQSVRDTKNFTVDKTARFAGRFFQVALAVFSWYFLSSQDALVIAKYVPDSSLLSGMWFFAVMSPVVSAFLVAVYLTPWFSHAWTSRRILLIETSLDFMMFIGWMGGFIGSVVLVNGRCVAPPATKSGDPIPTCTQYNWLISWLFFSGLAFLYALGIDFWSLYKGIYAPADIEHEILLDVRRTTRMNNR